MRSHKWVDNVCSACGLQRRRCRSMGHIYFWEYCRNWKLVGLAGRCPGKEKVDERKSGS